MEITFGTAKELKEAREQSFLALNPSQRVTLFLKSVGMNAAYGTTRKPADKGNFIIQMKGDWNSSLTRE